MLLIPRILMFSTNNIFHYYHLRLVFNPKNMFKFYFYVHLENHDFFFLYMEIVCLF